MFLAGRRAIPIELYEASAIDGASALQNFRQVTFPLLRNLYLICTLLSMVFTLGDFTAPWVLTGGAPGDSTHVLATLAYRYTFHIDGKSTRQNSSHKISSYAVCCVTTSIYDHVKLA